MINLIDLNNVHLIIIKVKKNKNFIFDFLIFRSIKSNKTQIIFDRLSVLTINSEKNCQKMIKSCASTFIDKLMSSIKIRR